MTNNFHPIKRNKRTFELVADEIKEAILSGNLKPGERLASERDLALQMQVGRPVIRESLRTLEMSGLIFIKPGVGGGVFVKEPDATNMFKSFSDLLRLEYIDIEQLTEARLLIEQDLLELVVKKAKPEDFKPLDDLIVVASEKIKRGEKIRKENFQFHIELAKLVRNPLLAMVVNSIVAIVSVFVHNLDPPLEHSKEILRSHKEILRELKRGNLLSANKRLGFHIRYFSKEFNKLRPFKGIKFDEAIPNVLKGWKDL